jgi:hypothetical protein
VCSCSTAAAMAASFAASAEGRQMLHNNYGSARVLVLEVHEGES